MTIHFFLYEIPGGKVTLRAEIPPVNSDWYESGDVIAEGGTMKGIKWDRVGAFYNSTGVEMTQGRRYSYNAMTGEIQDIGLEEEYAE